MFLKPAIEMFIVHDTVCNNLGSLSVSLSFEVHWVFYSLLITLFFMTSLSLVANLTGISFVQVRDAYTIDILVFNILKF